MLSFHTICLVSQGCAARCPSERFVRTHNQTNTAVRWPQRSHFWNRCELLPVYNNCQASHVSAGPRAIHVSPTFLTYPWVTAQDVRWGDAGRVFSARTVGFAYCLLQVSMPVERFVSLSINVTMWAKQRALTCVRSNHGWCQAVALAFTGPTINKSPHTDPSSFLSTVPMI